MIAHIPEMVEAGIDSFKIEGRMKTALYVAAVARTYRKAIDDYFESEQKYRSNMDWYRAEIAKCTYRQFTTGFYFGKPDETTQIYDSNTYVNESVYLGIVEEIRSASELSWGADVFSSGGQRAAAMQQEGGEEARDLQLARISQRNKFSVGDEIEIMKPSGENVPAMVEAMYTEEGEKVESAPHPKQALWLLLSGSAEQYDLLRMEGKG